LKLIFAGTPVFAQLALQALHEAGHEIALVLTRPDKPAQRGQKLLASPVRQWAQTHGIEVWQPRTLRDPEVVRRLHDIDCQAMVVAAYGLLLPPDVLAVPPRGCLNIHASLLPRWRGAAPIQRAVQAGDAQTGITIMQMDVGLDTGPIRLVRPLPIGRDETSGSVHDRLAVLGAQAIVEAIGLLEADRLPLSPQPADGVTHAAKIVKADALIDWSRPAQAIVDQLRAFDPAPGCVAELARLPGAALKVWRARAVEPTLQLVSPIMSPIVSPVMSPLMSPLMSPIVAPADAQGAGFAPGTVIGMCEGALRVACGGPDQAGAVDLLELQRAGGRRLPATAFVAGFPIGAGDRLQFPAAAVPPPAHA
jgi:methionyl-tRNA formyltransferase